MSEEYSYIIWRNPRNFLGTPEHPRIPYTLYTGTFVYTGNLEIPRDVLNLLGTSEIFDIRGGRLKLLNSLRPTKHRGIPKTLDTGNPRNPSERPQTLEILETGIEDLVDRFYGSRSLFPSKKRNPAFDAKLHRVVKVQGSANWAGTRLSALLCFSEATHVPQGPPVELLLQRLAKRKQYRGFARESIPSPWIFLVLSSFDVVMDCAPVKL
ncbi:hypothetical protein K0M31_018162 [Melipona bicolor]|uniref:Uncharacterized protein n=1 Tax=Melipona bicolor TaxID=60889 RepID=A0AA40FDV1_9HYME|nr:hypothetical protein K0M31_018162 [Melipona bicolor]